jgi:hypothetical protein
VLHAVVEETERAFVKVEQYTYTVALMDVACCIVAVFAIAEETASIGNDEPAVSALPRSVVAIRIEIGPGHTDAGRGV